MGLFRTSSPVETIRSLWNRLSRIPQGHLVFSKLIGTVIPYTGSIDPVVVEVRPGYAKMKMRDRRKVRNHLNSVHALAMANLGEFTTGLALNFGMPENVRGIVTNLSIDYLKKGRGTLTCECTCPIVNPKTKERLTVEGDIRDASGDLVATIKVGWQIEPKN